MTVGRLKISHVHKRINRLLKFIWLAVLVVFILMAFYPVNCRLTQIAELTALFVLWVGALYLTRKSKVFLTVVAALPLVPVLFFILPARKNDTTSLRRAYTDALCSYEGVRYWWGGENHFGIDCSGLVRRALIDTLIKQGALTLDGGALRNAAQMWWYDASARALRDSYRGWTLHLKPPQASTNLTIPFYCPEI